MVAEEYAKIEKEITELEKREQELYNWLKGNVSSSRFDDVRTEWNTVRLKLANSKDKLLFQDKKSKFPNCEHTGQMPFGLAFNRFK